MIYGDELNQIKSHGAGKWTQTLGPEISILGRMMSLLSSYFSNWRVQNQSVHFTSAV
jgi:hypothetical protein